MVRGPTFVLGRVSMMRQGVIGTNVDGSHKAATNGVIQIAFDRALLPLTVNRQSFVLLDYTTAPLAGNRKAARCCSTSEFPSSS